jgi:hypothetical protein
MARLPCPACGRKVFARNRTCPACGAVMKAYAGSRRSTTESAAAVDPRRARLRKTLRRRTDEAAVAAPADDAPATAASSRPPGPSIRPARRRAPTGASAPAPAPEESSSDAAEAAEADELPPRPTPESLTERLWAEPATPVGRGLRYAGYVCLFLGIPAAIAAQGRWLPAGGQIACGIGAALLLWAKVRG